MNQTVEMNETIKNSPLGMPEFYTAAEIADLKLPGVPVTKRGVNKAADDNAWHDRKNMAGAPLARKRKGQGGGYEYHYTLLPVWAQKKLVLNARRKAAVKRPYAATKKELSRERIWAFYDGLSDKKKTKAKLRLEILMGVMALEKGGSQKNVCVSIVASEEGVSLRSIYNWFNLVEGYLMEDWLAALVPHNAGRTVTAECHPKAWDFIKALYLRKERPTFSSCYRRLELSAVKHGWNIPAESTLHRRIYKEIGITVINLSRYGKEDWKQNSYPAQERDRSVFHALEAVNADGHKFDVFVQWPNEEKPGRAMMVVFQDLYSGKILSWRIDKSENKEAVRLAFGDVVDQFGIPEKCYLDNGRAFASKWLTGRTPNRYRFKIRDEDPAGIMTSMDVDVHWVMPHAGQSKPIERSFRDMCDDIAKDYRFRGAWTGNHVGNKPENYGSKAIPIDEFIQVVEEGIDLHNARLGRRAKICRGRSFDVTFQESYAVSPIRKATEVQKRLYLLAAEGVKATSRYGDLNLMGNRYWAEFLRDHKGQNLVIRYDPQNMHQGLHVYRLDGDYLGFAEIWDAAGFNDVAAARDHNSARKQMLKADKMHLAAVQKMGADEVIGYMAVPPKMNTKLDSKVVAPIFGDHTPDRKIVDAMKALKASTPTPAALTEAQQAEIEAMNAEFEAAKNVVKLPETAKQRFQKAHSLEIAIKAGNEVGNEDAMWLGQYQTSHEYKTQTDMLAEFGEMYLQF